MPENTETGGSSRLQILHASDLEGGVDAIVNAPNFAAIEAALEEEVETSITLSAGDNYIPGPFFNASADPSLAEAFARAYTVVYGLPAGDGFESLGVGAGRVDVTLMNLMGFDASAFGNHEFDLGPGQVESIIAADAEAGGGLAGIAWPGALFPYLSSNLVFEGSALEGLFTPDLRSADSFATDPEDPTADPAKIASSTIVEENGERVGVIGLTTPDLGEISSPGDVGVLGSDDDLSTLAAIVNAQAARLAGEGVDKIVLVSHLQQIALETNLAPLLTGVDVIIAGGSDTLLADGTDPLRPGDEADGDYPLIATGADGNPIAIVSTDGEYSYVGRLVVTFDENGVILPDSIDAEESGAYATTDAVVDSLYGDGEDPFADGTAGGEARALVQAVEVVVTEQDGNILGRTAVFLDGQRSEVRTEETNLGNLSADANLAVAQGYDDTVLVSIKNGGGIRAPIGEVGDDGALLPPQENPTAGKEAGAISELDVTNALRFNNSLSLVTLTPEQLRGVLEHAVAATAEGATPGQFAQIGGIAFSFDPSRPAGARVETVRLLDADGQPGTVIVDDGAVVDGAPAAIRVVTLSFLADGGDGYPFPDHIAADPDFANRVELAEALTGAGDATFADPGTEQDALAEYLLAEYADQPFDQAETAPAADERIQDLSVREDSLDGDGGGDPSAPRLALTPLGVFETGVFDGTAQEIPAYDPATKRLFVSNDAELAVDVLDVTDPDNPVPVTRIDLSELPEAGGVNSVAVANGRLAVAIENEDPNERGYVAIFDTDGTLLERIRVGVLPDSLVFTPDGNTLIVANEGEPTDDGNPTGTVSIIDLSGDLDDAVARNVGFAGFNGQGQDLREQGLRIAEGVAVARDLEPEYVAVSPDGGTAYVTLQENNAVAVIDIGNAEVTALLGLGTRNLSGTGIDPNDTDGVNIRSVPVNGLFQPDAIAAYSAGDGGTYLVTANEGDSRDGDSIRVADAVLDPTAFPNASAIQADEELGRLTVDLVSGDTDGDGDLDALNTYGTRSFTIWSDTGELVFDSGSDFETITAAQLGAEGFNANNDENGTGDDRSDNSGPEPEGIALGEVDGRTYAFIGLERTGGVMVYDVTDPEDARFVDYVNTRVYDGVAEEGTAGDLGPEGLAFIAAADSPTGEALLAVTNEVSGTTRLFRFGPEADRTDEVSIDAIQGAGHRSAQEGQTVTTRGIVTAVDSNGYYLQSATDADDDPATSSGILVFTGDAPTVSVGMELRVTGTVTEFVPGGADSGNLSTTEITGVTETDVLSVGNDLPEAVVLGEDRNAPTSVIDDDGLADHQPDQDGIDFYESLEGMRVTVNDAVAVSPTNGFGEIVALANGGEGATGVNGRGSIVIGPDDFNPERIQLQFDADLSAGIDTPAVDTGAALGDATGVLGYGFGNFELYVQELGDVGESDLERESASIDTGPDRLTIAGYNVENLDPNDDDGDTDVADGKFQAIARQILENLKTPDIVALQEVQDDSGSADDGTVSGEGTAQTLIDAIVAAGGPRYDYVEVAPEDGTTGGQPGGNIRNGYLYDPDRVAYVDGSAALVGRPGEGAFEDSRNPLYARFTVDGEAVDLINVHNSSKGGSTPLFGAEQPPVNGGEGQRVAQGEVINGFVDGLLTADPDANLVVLGDFNEFQFLEPLAAVTGTGDDRVLANLTDTLPEGERYSYNFEGNAQALDHILVGNGLVDTALYDVVHMNAEFAERASDHDATLVSLDLGGGGTADGLEGVLGFAERFLAALGDDGRLDEEEVDGLIADLRGLLDDGTGDAASGPSAFADCGALAMPEPEPFGLIA